MLEMLNPKTYGLNAAEAAIVLAVIGGIGVVAQRHAQVLWRAVKARLFVEVELTSAELADDYLQRWQALHKEHMVFQPRFLRVSPNENRLETLPGFGTFWYKVPGLPLVSITSERMGSEGTGFHSPMRVKHLIRLWLATPADHYALCLSLVQAQAEREGQYLDFVLGGAGMWQQVGAVRRKPETVLLDAELKADLIQDAKRFFSEETQAKYAECGTPHRRVFLFHGEPGTGKTTLARMLRTELQLPLYMLTLNGQTAGTVLAAITSISRPRGCIVLIDDLDTVKTAVNREASDAATDKDAVTLGVLLSILDGAHAPVNTLFVLNTNRLDAFDRAMLRKSRADRIEHIGPLSPQAQWEGVNQFLKQTDSMPDWFSRREPMLGCDLQAIFLQAALTTDTEEGKRRAVYFALCPPAKAVVSEDTVAASRCVVLNP